MFLSTAASAAPTSPCTNRSIPALQSTVTCGTPGSYILFPPTGTTSVSLDAIGAGGGAGYPARAHIGGNGAEVTGTATLPPQTYALYVIVGAAGTGDNHGTGTGGKASAVIALDGDFDVLGKLNVAGGGGSGAYNGDGGNAGSPGTSDNAQAVSGPGASGTGPTGGAGGTGNYAAGTAGGSDTGGSTVAAGGNGGAVPGGATGGGGGGGYGGGGGGGASRGSILSSNVAGGGGGSSFASSRLTSATVTVASGTGGIQLPGLVAGDGSPGRVTLTFNGVAVPGAPTSVSATPGDHQASVSFTAPASNGGSAITGYTVTSSPGGSTQSCATSPCVITGLTNGTAYTFTVHATNVNGNSVESAASTAVTPAARPGAPTAVVATLGDHQASVAFTAPASNGGSAITSYTVTSAPGGVTATCVGSPCVVTGLTNGTAYTFTVHATNAIGASVESAPSTAVTPAGVPAAPTAVSADPGDHQASVSFTAPANNGRPITSYTVTSAPGGATTSCASSPCVVTGLTNGTAYTFTVHATNAIGNSVESTPSIAVTPAVAPGAPTGVSATLGDHQASVSFTAPASNGGSPITSYTVTSAPGDIFVSCTVSPCLVTGLTNGTAYTFTVHATNGVGDSVESTPSAAVTPAGVPAAPSAVTLTPGDQKITVSFPAPDDQGAPITSYQVSTDGGLTYTTVTTTVDNGLTSATVTGLSNGTAYSVRVRALNAQGAGSASAAQSATPVTTPGAPTAVSATLGDGQASVSFTAPASDGGSPITSYTVTSAPGGVSATCPSSPSVVSGLSNGTSYTFTVHATTDVGDSVESSPSSAVTPAGIPSAPSSVTITPGDGQLTLSFPAPDDQGAPITSYQVSTDGGDTFTDVATTVVNGLITATVTGLTNGNAYAVQVRAVNAQGPGSPSGAQSVTPVTTPGVPTEVSAVRGDHSAQVSFTPPASDGGSAITSYTVTASPGGVTATCTESPCLVEGLNNGTVYTFTVHATSAVGDSAESAASNEVTPATVPDIPTEVTASPGDSAVTVSFTAPADGGSAITAYEYSLDGGATWTALSTTGSVTGTIAGLTNGTAYSVQVRAVNTTGAGPATTPVSVTPATSPDAPTAVTATAGPGRASVSFTAPTNNGGAPITSYTVTSAPGDITATCTESPCLITGLTNGTAYTFTVHATNTAGDSVESSSSAAVTPIAPPSAPRPAASATTTTVTLTFPAPASGGEPITGYQYSLDGGATWLTLDTTPGTGTNLTATITGLDPGTDYSILVRAVSAAGNGVASDPIAVSTRPLTPPAPTATPGTASVRVQWTQTGGASVTGYTVTAHPGPATCTTDAPTTTSCVIGATAGVAYTYTVVAHTGTADSAASPASPSVTAAAPVVPVTAPTTAPATLTTTTGTPKTVTPGQHLTVTGSGFLSYSSVTVILYSDPTVLGETVTNPDGDMRSAITIPTTLTAGTHDIVASGVDATGTVRFIRLEFTLTATSPSSTPPSTTTSNGNTGTGTLPNTGSPIRQLTTWAVLLIAVGTFLLTRSRRTRPRH